MSSACVTPMIAMPNRRVLSVAVLLASAIVAAKEDPRLRISPDDGLLLTNEMYEQAGDWRAPPAVEPEWRGPERKPKSRINFGYDSAFDKARTEDFSPDRASRQSLRDPQPNTLFRLKF